MSVIVVDGSPLTTTKSAFLPAAMEPTLILFAQAVFSCCFPKGTVTFSFWKPKGKVPMTTQKTDVQQGTLALMVLKTLEILGPLHGYGIARRIEQISGDLLTVNQGTLYPVLLRLEQ